MGRFDRISSSFAWLSLALLCLVLIISTPGVESWSKEGHIMTCRIAQDLLEPEAEEAVRNLLPEYSGGDLSTLCSWPDQVRMWHKFRWSGPLHYIDTPDGECTFDYSRDCRDKKGNEDMCVAGAVRNFTSQLLHYREGMADRQYNLTESLLFLSHFMGDIHQPLHCGFTTDAGGNTIQVRWFRRKSNLHHVWDRDIILQALKDLYDKDLDTYQEHIMSNITEGIWSDEISSWEDCDDLSACPIKYAEESLSLACEYGYKDVNMGDTLEDDYYISRLPVVNKQIAKGGVRLAMILNHVFRDAEADDEGSLYSIGDDANDDDDDAMSE